MVTTMEKRMTKAPITFTDSGSCADNIINKVGKKIVLGLPLGAGKPNHIVNALYKRAKADPDIDFTILSALTLERPKGKSLLEKRFFDPLSDRVFGDYPDLLFELDRMDGKLPDNVRVIEFYFPAGKFTNNLQAQKNYISSNYTHVARDLRDRGLNVLGQMIAMSDDKKRVSLSCNADVSLDIMTGDNKDDILFVGQVNANLPFMYGDADLPIDAFDFIVDNPNENYKLFGPPKMAVSDIDYMIGLHSSTLIRDDGELQIGIGSLGDALVYGLRMPHEHNDQYQRILDDIGLKARFKNEIERLGDLRPFEKGLFGATEMLVDSFMFLVNSGIMKKKVYDHIILQRLLNEGLIDENNITPEAFFLLLERRAIYPKISEKDFKFLQHFGIFRKELEYEYGNIHFQDGTIVEADMNNDEASDIIISQCLGDKLKNGAFIHAGFFVGPAQFYQWLRELPEATRRQIHMKSVTKINQLYGHEEMDRLHRKNARFVNTCMMMTLLGAAVSDGLADGRVISGVGGQYNFVEMAHALPDGHSVLQLRSTSNRGGKVHSNLVFNYGHITIPRHLRDVVVTEYGIAYVRGKTDEEVIKSLIQISDSRFQNDLINQAKAAYKLSADYEVPHEFRNNYPERIHELLAPFKNEGLFPVFPFGTDFTHEEQVIGKALKSLKKKISTPISRLTTIAKALLVRRVPDKMRPYLKRMQLESPRNFQEKLYRNLLIKEILG